MPEFAQLYTTGQAELDAGLYVLASLGALALAALCWIEGNFQHREAEQLRRVDDVRADPEYLFWLEVKNGPGRYTHKQLCARARTLARIRGEEGEAGEERAKAEIAQYVGRTLF